MDQPGRELFAIPVNPIRREKKIYRRYDMKEDSCPVFGVKSGVPIIGLGVLMILFALVPRFMPGLFPLPLPIELIFIGFGIFLIWLGFTK